MSDGEDTPEKTSALKPAWEPGQSGNPKGRPKGARNKLGEAFIADLLADWEENGAATIATVRAQRPQDYVKVVASILPKELNLRVSELDELTDEQIQRQLSGIVAKLAATGLDLIAGVGSPAAPQPAPGVSTVQ